jgi:polyribonucleotide nucleotidyltransferase
MFNTQTVELDWGGRPLKLETGKVARQADGAVVATYGETTVLATVVAAKQPKSGIDFLPLTVNYTEKYYAAGRIPGGYFKRERGPTEKDTLTSRLIDRPIRPLFAEGWRCDTQVIVTVLSHDQENDPDIVAMIAVSAALTLSGAPFMGPIGAARVGFSNGEYVLNPTLDEMKETKLDLVVAGTQDAVLMVESEAQELSEEIMLGAVMFGHRHFQPVIKAIIALAEKAAKEPREFAMPETAVLEKEMLGVIEQDLRKAYAIPAKHERQDAVAAAKKKVMEHFFPDGTDNPDRPMTQIAAVFKELEAKIVRWNILDTSKRIDGRDLVTVRPIVVEAGFLPRTHGSALFTRGETQAIVVATLGTSEDEQFIDALQGTYKESFLLHYNFPPFSVGETGRIGAPGRREIGHGKLAWRAIRHPRGVGDHRVERLVVDGDGLRHLARIDGRRRAAQAADRGHRDGPDPRRQALCRAFRHSRRRGSSRRHGLQGRGHLRRRDRAADGHQNRRNHRRDHEGRAEPGEGRPHAYPG